MTRYAAILLGILLIGAIWANAATKPQTTTIKVLSSDTETIPLTSDNNGAPKDCNIMDFSAYCHHSRNEIVRHKMVVEDSHRENLHHCLHGRYDVFQVRLFAGRNNDQRTMDQARARGLVSESKGQRSEAVVQGGSGTRKDFGRI